LIRTGCNIGGRERERAAERCRWHSREGESGCDVGNERRAERERASSRREWKNENQWRKKKGLKTEE
jgi:hypothetical protein